MRSDGEGHAGSECNQDREPAFSIESSAQTHKGKLHCIEPLPGSFKNYSPHQVSLVTMRRD